MVGTTGTFVTCGFSSLTTMILLDDKPTTKHFPYPFGIPSKKTNTKCHKSQNIDELTPNQNDVKIRFIQVHIAA